MKLKYSDSLSTFYLFFFILSGCCSPKHYMHAIEAIDIKLNYNFVQSKIPFRRLDLGELVVTKPIGETGIPLPDTVINNLVCEIGEQQKPVSKVNFHKPTSGYSWKYQITIMFPPEHPFYNMSAQEQVEFITKNYPVDSSHLGVFDKMPADFKIGVWYSLYGLDEKDNGTYYFIFQNDFEHVKIVKAVGPF